MNEQQSHYEHKLNMNVKFNNIITTVLFVFSFSFCQQKTPDQKETNGCIENSNEQINNSANQVKLNKTKFLTILGKDIWVRDLPSKGKVVLKLNEGDKCQIIEKGKLEIIKGLPDYWYKIEFNKTEGWVFGSQTDMMLFKPLDKPLTGSLSAICDDPLMQEIETPKSFSYLFKKENAFRFTVSSGYIIEGKIEWKSNFLKMSALKLIFDSPEGSKVQEIEGIITFLVFKKDTIIYLAEKENSLKDKTYSPSGGCFCLDK